MPVTLTSKVYTFHSRPTTKFPRGYAIIEKTADVTEDVGFDMLHTLAARALNGKVRWGGGKEWSDSAMMVGVTDASESVS
jgi:hypothetical protein